MFKVQALEINEAASTTTLTGNLTLTLDDAAVQKLDPGGAGRDVTLPTESISVGRSFLIRNEADAAEVLTIKDADGNTICTPTQNETALVVNVGGEWIGLVAAHN